MTNSSFVTGDPPSGAFSIGGGYWRHTADKNWLGADLQQAKDIVQATLTFDKLGSCCEQAYRAEYRDSRGTWKALQTTVSKTSREHTLTWKSVGKHQRWRIYLTNVISDVRVDMLGLYGCRPGNVR